MGKLLGQEKYQSEPELALSAESDGQIRTDPRAMPHRPIESLEGVLEPPRKPREKQQIHECQGQAGRRQSTGMGEGII